MDCAPGDSQTEKKICILSLNHLRHYNINTINAPSSCTFPNVAHRMELDCICNVVSPMLLNQIVFDGSVHNC